MRTNIQAGVRGCSPEKHLLHLVKQQVTSFRITKIFGSCTETEPNIPVIDLGSDIEITPITQQNICYSRLLPHFGTTDLSFCNRCWLRNNAIAFKEVAKPDLEAIALFRGWRPECHGKFDAIASAEHANNAIALFQGLAS